MLREVIIPEAFEEDIDRAIKILKEAGCTEVYLFGSVAEGRACSASDLDFAVRGCPPGKFFSLGGTLMLALKHPVDLVDLDGPNPFARHLEEQDRLLRVA